MSTLTNGATTITPDEIDGFAGDSTSENIVHVNLDGSIDVSIGPDQPLAGTLELVFASRTQAWTARAALRLPGVWTLTDTDVPSINMQFVRMGGMTIELDDETRSFWVLSVGYQAVTA